MSASLGASIVTTVCVAAALTVVAAPAAATGSRPFVERSPFVEEMRCGDVVGVTGGTAVETVTLTQEPDGAVRFRLVQRVEDGTFEGSDGRTYRVVGTERGSGQLEPEFVLDRLVANIVIVGDGGRLGALQTRWDGESFSSSGGCEFV